MLSGERSEVAGRQRCRLRWLRELLMDVVSWAGTGRLSGFNTDCYNKD